MGLLDSDLPLDQQRIRGDFQKTASGSTAPAVGQRGQDRMQNAGAFGWGIAVTFPPDMMVTTTIQT